MDQQSTPTTSHRVPVLSAGIGANGSDGVLFRSELLELWAEHGHAGVLADLADPTGWPPNVAVIAESLYSVSTSWLVGASVLKAKGAAGDLLFAISNDLTNPNFTNPAVKAKPGWGSGQ